MLYIGIDIGSVSVNTAVLDETGRILNVFPYTKHLGEPIKVVIDCLKSLLNESETIANIGVTGSGGRLISNLLGINFVNEMSAQSTSVKHLYNGARTIIEIGGADSKFIDIETEDYAMNELCAAGTGSFLDQQASRLGLSIEEFSDIALKSNSPPRIAGRCSVFAKTDMIHLQQEGTPDYDIVAGLCYALARNFKSNVAKGREFKRPIVFQGGCAYNKGVVRAFEEVIGLSIGELIVPEHCASMGAIGVALVLIENSKSIDTGQQTHIYHNSTDKIGDYIKILDAYLKKHNFDCKVLERLELVKSKMPTDNPPEYNFGNGKVDAFIGIDVGSISTNVVAIDRYKKLIAKCYLMTAGRPIEAVRRGIEEISKQVGNNINVVGVGTTGSGRYMIGDFVGADVVINEITAQAKAASDIDSKVDTIFEIGGQDSKYISLENGAIVDFEMNKVCAAGTGSFLEEQAERLGITIEEFGDIALASKSPLDLGERCTVFMETNLVSYQQKGAIKADLVAGLAYSIVTNYLNRVVGKKRIGDHIFFQGAVAFNKGVVAAFEKVLGKSITVPQNHHVTGAIGAAIIALERVNWRTKFRGFDTIPKVKYSQNSFECNGCPNRCEIKSVVVEDSKPLFYGGRCEKYEKSSKFKPELNSGQSSKLDLFTEREEMLLKSYKQEQGYGSEEVLKTGKHPLRIGIPYALLFHECLPFFNMFFNELGFKVVLSDPTNKRMIYNGLERVVAETCFPVKVAHGHVLNLLDKGVDYVFLPSIIDTLCPKGMEKSYTCPYNQEIPHIIKAAIKPDIPILHPILHFRIEKVLRRELLEFGQSLGKSKMEVTKSFLHALAAQQKFYSSIKLRGKEVLKNLESAIVIVGRAYNICDQSISLGISRKLRELGVTAIPMDYLPVDDMDISSDWPNMYWKSGHRILSAARVIRDNPRLNCIYITNFGCGPDSFITQFFRKEIGNKPFLQIEVDEHSADVGVMTRCEAFLDSLSQKMVAFSCASKFIKKETTCTFTKRSDRTIYIPHMGDYAFALLTAFKANGIKAELLSSDDETLEWGRKFTLGKECYPCIITTGDMIKVLKRNDPSKVAFLMPTAYGPCRFGQYNKLQRMILDELGYEDVPIISPLAPESNEFYKTCNIANPRGIFTFLKALQGVIAIDCLDKMLRKTRPYEANIGETDSVYKSSLYAICDAIERGGVVSALQRARTEFEQIPVINESRPKIGIVGEIFVRNHVYSNNNIVRRIESLGGEVVLPSAQEWGFHTSGTRRLDYIMERKYLPCFFLLFFDKFLKYFEHGLFRKVKDFSMDLEETEIYKIWDAAAPYLIKYFGEAALSIGNAVNWAHKGRINGLINVMPFTCMPGTVTTAVLKRFREDYRIPCLDLTYDGLEQSTIETRLEVFMYQAKRHREKTDLFK
ncbi:MAG: acyl-CoA dehydratase activase [bacterium]|nr:acyl-CoA dehydratase activase [bacterium]